MAGSDYHQFVRNAEETLAPYAQRSFSPDTEAFLNGTPILKHFQDLWQNPAGQMKLANRTPLQLERDRILYSASLRKQTEKYHVLYNASRRVIRNYTTHTMRMAHVTRAICKALRLNSDFAEAIAIGAKVGAAPFIHVTKRTASSWLQDRLRAIGKVNAANKQQKPMQATLFPGSEGAALPAWLQTIESRDVVEQITRCVPCAVGEHVDAAYHSGAESYWLLCTNPYTRESERSLYHPETMYGVWRHTRNLRPKAASFFHKATLENGAEHQIDWRHSTYEGAVVQFADDMTWIIENLNDANDAALLGGSKTNLYLQLLNSLTDAPLELQQALVQSDAGGLYTYFISDFVRNSSAALSHDTSAEIRTAMRTGDKHALIGPSPVAEALLERFKAFLDNNVFDRPRIRNRNRMLESVSTVALDLLFEDRTSLSGLVEDRANLENWPDDKKARAVKLLDDDVHRAQLSIDVFVSMGDQELFDFVGIQAF
jgi:dGTP triphosphohydrolase